MALVAVFVLSVLAGVVRPTAAEAQESVVQIPMDENGMPTRTFFPETGHHLSDEILTAWRSTGLMIFGYPISEPMIEDGRTVQYFERARLEHWPEYEGTQWEVQGSLLGNWMGEKRRNQPAFKRGARFADSRLTSSCRSWRSMVPSFRLPRYGSTWSLSALSYTYWGLLLP